MDQTSKQAVILIVEDDREIGALLSEFLGREGYEVEVALSGSAMDMALGRTEPDMVILDLMLPGEDGLSICRRLRARSRVPILMLTAKDDDIDRIVGLELGADDYLGKPFNPRELLARIRAILRRSGRAVAEDEPRRRRRFHDFIVDIDMRSLEIGERRVALTSAEFDLLVCFIEHPRRVLSRDQLLDWTRGRMSDPLDRTIDVSVSRLRRKLTEAAPGSDGLITTVRNGGYLFAAEMREG
ncbi:response regulator [Kaistia dalseonensis]|uniref:Two-component system OmpR family response regulator n=1 Tax=Kaistia dalseonensis TaxID=410840 RepID=A0ABU0H4P0_9HYPH|nr:response regulator [Kaistia dalseonensis]MCX5494693.1 response regulator [Kaistia dalseonensis]MDQ0437274.1 two-component system OmpR family response regulator [Kaistia dalseonensis]